MRLVAGSERTRECERCLFSSFTLVHLVHAMPSPDNSAGESVSGVFSSDTLSSRGPPVPYGYDSTVAHAL